MSAMPSTADSRTRVSLSAWRLQSTFSRQVRTVSSRWSLVVSGIPAYAGTEPSDDDARHDLEAEAGLRTGERLLGAGGVDERVAGHQPDDAETALGLLDDDLRAGGVGQRLAVLAEAAVDELGAVLGARRCRPAALRTDERLVLGRLGDRPRRPRGGGRRPARSAGPGHRGRCPRRPPSRGSAGWWRRCWSCLASCVYCLLTVSTGASVSSPAPSASMSVRAVRPNRRRPEGFRWPTSGRERVPSGDIATARTHSSSPSSPSATSASAPIGAEQPPSRVASTARSAVTAARVAGSSRRGQLADQVGVVGPALDGQRALARGGQHLQRVEHLGGVVEPADAGQAGAGEHDRVVLPRSHLADRACRRCRGCRRSRGPCRGRASGRRVAASRCRRGCRPAARRGSARRGRRPRRGGPRGEVRRPARSAGRAPSAGP